MEEVGMTRHKLLAFCSSLTNCRNLCRIVVFAMGLALVCLPQARAGRVVTSCDENSLRTALTGGGLITFECSGTITLTATITISANTTIDGGGQNVTISGGNALTVLFVPTGVRLNLNKLTIANGSADSGGGIYSQGMLTVINSTFSGNSAQNDGGGIENDEGTLTVRHCKFASNTSAYGGGISNLGGTVTVNNSTFSGNSAQNDGGGIENTFGTLTVTNTTFSGNTATGEAGGIGNDEGTLTVTNTTFSGNTATDVQPALPDVGGVGVGGGIENYFGTLTMTNSTLSGNLSPTSGGIINRSVSIPSTSTMINTIVVNNPNYNCDFYVGDPISGGSPLFGSSGFSLISGGNLTGRSCVGTGVAPPDPLLGPLKNNGGATQTMALGASSPAIGNAIAANCPISDQRGFPRHTKGAGVITVNGLSELGSTVTVTLSSTGYYPVVGDSVQISGGVPAGYLGVWTITSVNGLTFTYTSTVTGLAPSGGGTVDFPSACSIGAYEPGTLFASFHANGTVNLATQSFSVTGTFTLGAGSDGIFPVTEAVQFRFGSFSTTIAAGSFQFTNGSFVFVRLANGFPVFRMTIQPLGGNKYSFAASAQPVNLTGTVAPIIVQLTIGDDGGTTHAPAEADD
jgi:hypothetical protein